ncbi:MAG: SCO family protein [Candidatus Tectomicrobia bacterium]|nr:SCO family protein [Candidatus Tectomicrobia bacterium]
MAGSRKAAALLVLLLAVSPRAAAAHTPDWVSHLFEWVLGKKAAVGEAPSAGWLEPEPAHDFRLLDQEGGEKTLRDYRGRVVVMNFFHATCGNTCGSMKELRILARSLGKKMGAEVVFLSVSLDAAEHPSGEAGTFDRQWRMGPRWQLLHGPSAAIEELAKAYGVYFKKIESAEGKNARTVEYSDVILFLDQQGRLRKRVLPHLLQLSGREDVGWLLQQAAH